MRILILNWRDIKNPVSGGAEVLTHEMAKFWVNKGHQVTQISAGFQGSAPEETIDGVKIIRKGRWWSIHMIAFFYYFFSLRKAIDVVIDEVHWFPFFSAIYARKKTVFLVCEIANKLFFHIFPYPIAFLGRIIEKGYLVIYRNIPTLAISPSTKEDLIKEGFKRENITVLPMGITLPKGIKNYKKKKKLILIFLGRINKQKGIEDAIKALELLKKDKIIDELWVVGSNNGSYMEKLRRMVDKLKITSSVIFFGFVGEREKFKLLSEAHILIVPSVHEGWGLTVPEAGYMGTPVVAYNSKGLRDVIKNGENGLLVEPTPDRLADGVRRLISNKNQYSSFQEKARIYAKQYNWENTGQTALNVLERIKK